MENIKEVGMKQQIAISIEAFFTKEAINEIRADSKERGCLDTTMLSIATKKEIVAVTREFASKLEKTLPTPNKEERIARIKQLLYKVKSSEEFKHLFYQEHVKTGCTNGSE